MPENSRVLIFTGGHHSSGLPVAQKLISHGWKIIWIGHRSSMWGDKSDSAEYQEVTRSGIQFIELKAGKFYRTLHPLKLLRLPWGFIRAFCILKKLRRDHPQRIKGIVSFGGYLSVPVAVMGWLLGISCITHEQTMVGGLANQIISPIAKVSALSWPSPAKNSLKSTVTGLPLRPEILQIRRKITKNVPPVIYITGGKQGSHLINQVVFSSILNLAREFEIIHQTGSSSLHSDYQKAVQIRAALPPDLLLRYHIYSYLSPDQVARTLSRADVVISRSGAHITYELAYLGIPCVLIPIPWSSRNEQAVNAGILVSYHQAVMLKQDSLSPQSLYHGILQALQLHPDKIDVTDRGLENLVAIIEKTFSS